MKVDNWFKFTSNQSYKEMEFVMPTMQDNENFEKMIAFLKEHRIKYKYFSI